MTPNPYQSPQEAGYAPNLPPLPLWHRIVAVVAIGLAIAWAGCVIIVTVLAMVDAILWPTA
jgi:hypothetical protein